jgi:hypothetical protein
MDVDRDRERNGDKDNDPINVKNNTNLGNDSIWVHLGSIHEISKGKKSLATVPLSYTGKTEKAQLKSWK